MGQETHDKGVLKVDAAPGGAKLRLRIAFVLNAGVVLWLLLVGVDYVTSGEPKPHHQQFLEVPFHTLTPGTQLLIMTLMKGTGLAALVTSLSLAILLVFPFRRHENWSRWAILAIAGFTLIPTLVKTLEGRALVGISAPWWPHVVMLVGVAIAFWLTADFSNSKS